MIIKVEITRSSAKSVRSRIGSDPVSCYIPRRIIVTIRNLFSKSAQYVIVKGASNIAVQGQVH